MSAFDNHFKKVSSFLTQYQSLVDSHLVDFITEDLWSKFLPQQLRIELETLGSDRIVRNDPRTPELNKYLESIDSLSLEKCPFVHSAKDLEELFSTWGISVENLDSKGIKNKLEFMNAKKSYEVEIVANVTSALANFHSSIIVDAGAGKGYLSEHISQRYKIPLLAIDSSPITHKGAVKRQNIIRKKSSQSSNLVHHLVHRIDDSTDFTKLAETYFPDQNFNGSLTITGLHTCGSLGHSVIRAFINTSCIKSLCVVTCCYHLTEVSISGRLNLSKNAKMLAQQSVERMHDKNDYLSPTLHYRAVLQVLLHSMGLYDVRIGRGAPIENFVTYARWALRRIGIDSNEIPSENVLEEFYHSHESFKSKMKLFQTLRVRLGAVVESAILLDRIIYLAESKVCSNFALVRLFDPVISPRCYGIIASK